MRLEGRAFRRDLGLDHLILHRLRAEQMAGVRGAERIAFVDEKGVREALDLLVRHGFEIAEGVGIRERARACRNLS
ncbi:MAG: hypothetical protein WDN28_02915 [Chthoniobacter sp.]